MKRKILLCCVLAFIMLFSSCGKNTKEPTTVLNTTTTAEITEITESTTIPTTEDTTQITTTATTTVQNTTETTTRIQTTEKATSQIITEITEITATEVVTESVTEKLNFCTMEIDCSTILQNEKKLSKSAKDKVPSDGVILAKSTVEIKDGDTVLGVLLRITEEKGIDVNYTDMPMFNSCYIEGINGIFEKDCGSASGWMYSVNGEFPQVGANAFTVSAGDEIAFVYTCNGGSDVS